LASLRCFSCSSGKFTASEISFAAEILGCHRFGGQNNSETARCFSLFPAVFAAADGDRQGGDAKAGFTSEVTLPD
jgi:hypothetical protein